MRKPISIMQFMKKNLKHNSSTGILRMELETTQVEMLLMTKIMIIQVALYSPSQAINFEFCVLGK